MVCFQAYELRGVVISRGKTRILLDQHSKAFGNFVARVVMNRIDGG